MSFEKEYLDIANKYPKELLERENKIRDDASSHNRYASKEAKDKIKDMSDKIEQLGEKLGNKITSLELEVARLPEKLSDKFDDKYAPIDIESKVKTNCDDIKSISEKMDRRTYDWLKFGIITFISILVSVLLTQKL